MASGVTDANGNATFTNVAAGAHSVSVSASGYQPDSGTINATADGQTFQVVLTALGVAVAPVMTINGSQTSVQVAKGASLQYSITGLTPNGTVHINTAGHGTSFTWTADATGSVSNTTNTGTTPAGVYVVTAQDVTSGQTSNAVTVTVTATGAYTITIHVQDQSGAAVPGSTVTVT